MASVSSTSLIKSIASATSLSNTPTDSAGATDAFGAVLNSANETSSSTAADALALGSTHEEKQESKDENAAAMAGALAALLNQVNTREAEELASNRTMALSALKNMESDLKLADAATAKAMQNANLVESLNDAGRKLTPATPPTGLGTLDAVSSGATLATASQINTVGNDVTDRSPLNHLKSAIPLPLLNNALANNRAEAKPNPSIPIESLAINRDATRQSLLRPASEQASPLNIIQSQQGAAEKATVDANATAQNAALRALSSQTLRAMAPTTPKAVVKTAPQFNSAAFGPTITPPPSAGLNIFSPQVSSSLDADNTDAGLTADAAKSALADRSSLAQPQTNETGNTYQFINHHLNINNIQIDQKALSNASSPQFTLSDTPGSAAWNQSFGDRVVWLAGQPMQQARLQLHPKELGQVDVNLSIDRGSVIATFGVQHAAAAAAVQNALPHLHTLLEQHGLALGQATVSHQDTNQSDAHTPSQKPAVEFQATEFRPENRDATQIPTRRAPLGLLDDFA